MSFNPQPKQFREKKPRQQLRSNSRLKTKSRTKQRYNPDPFPPEAKKEIWERQNGKCAHPNCEREIEEYHHTRRKGMGGSKHPDRHNPKYGLGLCSWHHIPLIHSGGKEETYWRKYWEDYCEKQIPGEWVNGCD